MQHDSYAELKIKSAVVSLFCNTDGSEDRGIFYAYSRLAATLSDY